MAQLLEGAIEENVLTLLVWHDVHAISIAAKIEPLIFSTHHYQKIAEAAIKFIQQYKEPPKDHINDLLERDLSDTEPSKFMHRTIVAMKALAPKLNTAYVMDLLDKFVRVRTRMLGLADAYAALRQGDEDAADDLMFKRPNLRRAETAGIWLHDTNLDFLRQHDEDFFSTGIPALDAAGIRPERGTMMLLIAPKKFGKSWCCVGVGKANVMFGRKVLHITLENSSALTKRRYIQAFFAMTKRDGMQVSLRGFEREKGGKFVGLSDVTTSVSRKGVTLENATHIQHHLRLLQYRSHLLIKEFPTGTLTTSHLNMYLDQIAREENFIPDLLILDYPDLMKLDRAQLRVDTGRQFTDLRGICVERNMAGFFPTQGNRQSDNAHEVRSTHVAEDWSKVGTADVVLTGNRTPQERERNLARILVDAARDEVDQFFVVLSQAFDIGQFCIDSERMDPRVRRELGRISGLQEGDTQAMTREEKQETEYGAT